MKLKRLWMAVLCTACLVGTRNMMASEALVTMNGKPILTSEEVMKRFDTGLKMALNLEMVDIGVALADLSINDLPISRTTVKEWVPGIVRKEVIESIVQEWFKKHTDQENIVAKETLQECQGRLSGAYEEKECLEKFLPDSRVDFFLKKHSIRAYFSEKLPEEGQKILDTYKKEFGIKVHEDNINKVVDRIVSEWNIQK